MGLAPQLLALDAVTTHELGHEEGAQSEVLLLLVEANLSGSALGSVGHLGLGIVRGVLEQATLRQHARSHGSARVAQFRDVRLLGKTIDSKIGVGVGARLTVDLLDGVLKYHLLILSRHSC